MPNPPAIDHNGGTRAFYVPKLDAIHLPATETFTSQAGYYSTKFHELGHSTGHPKRLDRKGIDAVAAFGTATYSKEELVAEFASAFLCGEVGIGDMRLEQSSAYIASWLRALRSDPKMAIMAAAQAQKATDYILGTSENKGAAPDAAPARVIVTPDLFTSFRKHFGTDAMRRIPSTAGRVLVVMPELAESFRIRRSVDGRARVDAKLAGRTTYEPAYMVPGKDHRKKPGKATFRGKGAGMKCTSIRYYGTRAVPFTPPPEVMDALNGVTRAAQAVGRVLCGGETRPAINWYALLS